MYPPSGFYWDEFVRNVEEEEGTKLEMRRVRDVTEIYGNPVLHFAHKADVIRLEALKETGGVYLDVDVLITRGEGKKGVPLSLSLRMRTDFELPVLPHRSRTVI